jgi:outer membrane biogenesis lipoprotein LolB
MKKYLLLPCIVLLCSCAVRHPAHDMSPELQSETTRRLRDYLSSGDRALEPFRIQMSLRFGTADDTRRVTALFWGNNAQQLRLDIMAGIGASVAKIVESGEHFLVYSPNENKAWFHHGAGKPLLRVGVPIPFDLSHLADLLNGRYASVFGRECGQAELLPDGLLRCALSGAPGGELTLGADGVPRLWRENSTGNGWEMRISHDESAPALPRKLAMTADNGQQAIVLVKEYEKSPPFTDEQLRFALPEGTPLLPLEQFRGKGW